jgi:hypothetical protein
MCRNVMSEALQRQQQLAARSRARVKSLSQTPNVRSLGAALGGHQRRDAITQNAVRLIVFIALFCFCFIAPPPTSGLRGGGNVNEYSFTTKMSVSNYKTDPLGPCTGIRLHALLQQLCCCRRHQHVAAAATNMLLRPRKEKRAFRK